MVRVEEKKSYGQILGIIGICALMYSVSNFSVSIILENFNQEKPTVPIVFFNRILLWVCLFLFFLYVKYYLKEKFIPWEEQNLSLWKTVVSIIGIIGFLVVGFVVLVLIIQSMDFATQWEGIDDIRKLTLQNLPLLIFTCFTAAVIEEILFRGYILPTLSNITNSVNLGIIISSILFGLMHLSYGTAHQVIIPIYFGIIFSTYYSKFRNLKVVIFCHFIWNLVVYLDSAGLL